MVRQPTPWWGRVLAVVAIVCALPSLIFIPVEAMPSPHGPAVGWRESVEMAYFLSGLFGPFLTPVAVVLGLIVLVVPGIRLGLRLGTAAVVAASVPATIHILKAFTAKFH
jgi:hypothetical protein